MHNPAAPGRSVRFGPFELDVRSGELYKGQTRLKVPDQSIEILKALVEQPGELVARERLRERLWPADTFVDFEHGLNAAVRRLREALGDSADRPRYIETLPRRGYRFIGAIEDQAPAASVRPSESAIEIAEPVTSHAAGSVPASGEPVRDRGPRARVTWIVVTLIALVVTAAAVAWRRAGTEEPVEPTRFTVSPPEGHHLDNPPQLAVSPDGRHLMLVARSGGVSRLWLKSRSSPVPTLVDGTDGASYPFWSPDSQSVAFFAARRLWKVRLGALPQEICDAPAGRGGTWNRDNEIVFAPGTDGPILKVSAAGGPTTAVTALDKSRRDTTHRFPHFLPDGRSFLFWAGGGPTIGEIQIGSLDSMSVASTGIRGQTPMFSSNHVLFSRDGSLLAQAFDRGTGRLTGDAINLADDVSSFSVSDAGPLAHATARLAQPTWLDRAGNPLGTAGDPPAFMLALSPGQERAATTRQMGPPTNGDLWLLNVTPPFGARRFTSARGHDFFPVWSPDGRQVAFASVRNGRYQIFRSDADFSREEQLLLDDSVPPQHVIAPTDWSRDGAYIAYTKSGPATHAIWMLPLSGDRQPFPFRQSTADEGQAHFSPDGRWVAFTSQQSGGRREVHVAPFGGNGPVQQVSVGGGTQPMWQSDGSELFFLGPDGGVMSVAVKTGRRFEHSPPRKLFEIHVNQTVGFGNEYAVSSDGQRFLANLLSPQRPITVVLDWLTLPKR
jgi:Tol biopolymer transport system component/DNA-binding winged helix-turn-helix (wHTH) protein